MIGSLTGSLAVRLLSVGSDPAALTDWIAVFVAILIGALVILGAVVLLTLIDSTRSRTTPPVREIADALLPFIYQAILAGEKSALWGMQEADAILTGTDKAQVANSLYALLPDTLIVSGVPLPISVVKALVPRETFARWVKEAYDSAHAFILRNEDYLHSQVKGIAVGEGK